MNKKYTTNQLAVSEKAFEEIEYYIDNESYNGLSTKDILIKELKNVEYPRTKNNLQAQVKDLVYGGFFAIPNYEIMEFLETLNLNGYTMERANEEPMEVYSEAMYHAIKRLVQ